MSVLPDELWRRILEIGIESSALNYQDLCRLSIACRRLRRLSGEDSLWSSLLSSDFPLPQSDDRKVNRDDDINCKTLYKVRYGRDRERKLLAHRRAILRIESEIAMHLRKIKEIELQTVQEKEKMNNTDSELQNLQRARQASVALNVWQPEIIRDRQKQTVAQCSVNVESRISTLDMEFRLCKQQIAGLQKALRVEKRRLDAAKERLACAKYHPLADASITSNQPDEHRKRRKKSKSS